MFEDKVVVLSGSNQNFNKLFIDRFYNRVKELKIITDDIFDKSYDELSKVKLYFKEDDLNIAFDGVDYLYHFVDEQTDGHNLFFGDHDENSLLVNSIIKSSLQAKVKRVIFISDGSTSLTNDKMIKDILVHTATNIERKRDKSIALNYVVAKGFSDLYELLDFTLFATKTGYNGDIFVKKLEQKVSFAQRLKTLISPKTKLQEEKDSFFTPSEMARAMNFGLYFKIGLDENMIGYNKFEDRLKALKIDIEELQEA